MTRRTTAYLRPAETRVKSVTALDVCPHGLAHSHLNTRIEVTMTAATQEDIPAQLAADLAAMLTRLKAARADTAPDHNTRTCDGCYSCVLERQLNRLIDRLPRQAPVS